MGHVRKVAVVTVGRSDFGISRPVLRRLRDEEGMSLLLLASGTHLEPAHGMTVREIEEEGFEIRRRIPLEMGSDAPLAIAGIVGRGVARFAEALEAERPDLLLLVGDRFETFSAAVAALPLRIPVGHIHGGELTLGAFDDALRHSITKLSHLHFVATEEYGRRVRQLGEEPWRVVVSGAPALDNLTGFVPLGREEMERKVGVPLDGRTLLATFHPETLGADSPELQVGELLAALEAIDRPVVFTAANADPGGAAIREAVRAFTSRHAGSAVVDNLGTKAYFSLMASCAAMVGNSSSGIVEAPSFHLPVVNVGGRQEGRVRARNVIDVGGHRAEILAGIRRALEPRFRASIASEPNPYGDGRAADRIVETLRKTETGERLLRKKFVDVDSPAGGGR